MAKVVYYSGRVQGVGFRATAVSIARRHPAVRGWVRNLPDGRVELLVDGSKEAIDSFLDEVRTRMSRFIEGEDVSERGNDSSITGFQIVS
jgi:acylphosphatase